ncbi:MAG: hypothetical protein IT203_04600 [Fimbriimonadaceae bacterium]|nr:hypothetical protein [Fimbriimonadaceae bacterium]
MLKKDFETDDPYALVGQGFPCPPGYDSMGEMARCFIEEFAMIGYSEALILNLFKSPYYQGPHGVFKARGEGYVRDLMAEVFSAVDRSNPHV